MNYTNEEKETVCVYDYIDGIWDVYSCVPRHLTKLRKIAEPFWEEKDGDRVTAARWKLKGSQVRFAVEIVSKMTSEQKEASRARMKRMREKRNDIVTK
ncbi:hypothetical protein EDM52_18465 [Brevibacillus invocatus]|uniref:Uncharacterized protein n=1 Tax=Brevibacillus invocatus TaxID=173959 RepID=A0A3M8C3C7_9BACL|nr:hypothetical protein [Brevibacillus invocatus]RNB69953.1 hypothetical protein EDM52_18465 [Brevibacillus invocatus]